LNNKTDKQIWETPWGYKESFLIGLSLMLIGFLLEFISKGNINVELIYPNNIYFGVIYSLIVVLGYIFLKQTNLLKWFVGVPAAISSFVFIIFLVMIMGVIPQDINYGGELINNWGLNKMTTHWAFFFIMFYFLTALGFVTVKRILNLINGLSKFNIRNLGFVISHFGLWFTILTALLGANDIQHLKIKLDKGTPYNVAITSKGEVFPLDFFIQLNEFTVKEFPPKLAIVDNISGEIIHNNGKNLFEISDSLSYNFRDYNISVKKYIENSAAIGKNYAPVYQIGALPSVEMSITNTKDSSVITGWVTCGNFMYQYQSLKFSEEYSLLMTMPEVKHFESKVSFYSKEITESDISIEVNKPYDFGGYKVYQLGYEETKGKWSEFSILELVKDPWLNIVYFGLYLLIAGTVILLLTGKKPVKQ
jgi:hypothetical protein